MKDFILRRSSRE